MYENKKILILGMARSGFEAAKLLAKHGNKVTVTDMNKQDEENVKILNNLGVEVIITDKPDELLDETFNVIVKNPGIRRDHKCLEKARGLNISIVNEMEVGYSFLPKDIKIVGITGSNGKTTTTTMIYEILSSVKDNVFLGGNIGYPLCSLVEKVVPGSTLVLEISDHQLVDMYDFKTDISILTNIFPNHLDFHKDYDTYKAMKKKIFNHHTKDDLAIINYDNIEARNLALDIDSKITYFSTKEEKDCYLKDGIIYYNNEEVLNTDDVRLKGNHNYENIMCVIMVLKEFNVSNDAILDYLKEFNGVEHRIEYVTKYNDILFYNDSKATNVDSTIIAVDSFKNPTILLLGGLDRGHDFNPLNEHLKNTKLIVCYGETKNRIKEWADNINVDCHVCDTLIESTKYAYSKAVKGDLILLSPGCASWDQYKTFEQRGEEFKNTVRDITK